MMIAKGHRYKPLLPSNATIKSEGCRYLTHWYISALTISLVKSRSLKLPRDLIDMEKSI